MNPNKSPCPCGSNLGNQQCCGLRHEGVPASDAPSLMRSRYTAYVLCNEPYLLDTWHPSTRPRHIAFDPQQRWLGLKLTEVKVTGAALPK